MTASQFALEVRPNIPVALARLPELASNLIYAWDRDIRGLFRTLDNALFESCAGNLKLLLRWISQAKLEDAARDPEFLVAYQRVLSSYDAYLARQAPPIVAAELDCASDLIAYFCFEFGLHESVQIYSGGLGILAGDHLKAASDLCLPIVGIGMFYHQGFFEQHLDRDGNQIEIYRTTRHGDLPFEVVMDTNGGELRVSVLVGDQTLSLRVWRGRVGHVRLFLLDAEVAENPEELRSITHRLYGGDHANRIMQEIVLGIGGVRALRAMDLAPTVWHLNEGHSAFMIVERYREWVAAGHTLDAAVELVAGSTVFTTHTPVPAGHDSFDVALVERYLGPYLSTSGIDVGRIRDFGHDNLPTHLNMTSLSLRGSRFRNAVSRVHREVTSRAEAYLWPQISPEENPIIGITNGVHLQTFLALEWMRLFDARFPNWRSNLSNVDFWRRIDGVAADEFAAVRRRLKEVLLADVQRRLEAQHRRAGTATSRVDRMTRQLTDVGRDVLILGFARRFATYKRAGLIFSDRERLARLMSSQERPVLLLMAGKAHPHDEPGKQLIQQIYELSMQPEFLGRVLFIENYDLALARRLVAGADVWINTPEHPQEASGTSGMKAAINGAINLSVLDGWWAEAWDGTNGWGIRPHDASWDREFRDREESRDLLETLEHDVIPLYFGEGPDHGWIAKAKASMRTIIPRFNAERMVSDYVRELYGPAARQHRRLTVEGGAAAGRLADWKRQVRDRWGGVGIRVLERPPGNLQHGERAAIEVDVSLNGLVPADVVVECLVSAEGADAQVNTVAIPFRDLMVYGGDGDARFALDFIPPFPGLQTFRVRMFPHHELLTHRFEMGRMIWA